jgi:hypothetical protein
VIGPVYTGRKTCRVHEIVRRAERRYARQRVCRWLVIHPTR